MSYIYTSFIKKTQCLSKIKALNYKQLIKTILQRYFLNIRAEK